MLSGSDIPLKPALTLLSKVLKSLCRSGAQFRHTSRRAAKNDPLSPTKLLAFVSSRRNNISYLTYAPSPLTQPSWFTKRSTLLTQPTVGSAKLLTIEVSAFGGRVVATSENTRISLVVEATANCWAASLPPFCGKRASRTPEASNDCTISSVRSVEQSEATMISRR